MASFDSYVNLPFDILPEGISFYADFDGTCSYLTEIARAVAAKPAASSLQKLAS